MSAFADEQAGRDIHGVVTRTYRKSCTRHYRTRDVPLDDDGDGQRSWSASESGACGRSGTRTPTLPITQRLSRVVTREPQTVISPGLPRDLLCSSSKTKWQVDEGGRAPSLVRDDGAPGLSRV